MSGTGTGSPAGPHPEEEEEEYAYLSGLGNSFSSEAIPGSLPANGQNSPLLCPLGLYAEQLSGTSFTTPRHRNQRTWMYRIKPSVTHDPFHPRDPPHPPRHADFHSAVATPPSSDGGPRPSAPRHAGHRLRRRPATPYAANKSMDGCAFCNADGDFLIVPQQGSANGLASAKDFLSPTAWFEQAHRPGYVIVQKYGGELFTAMQDFSPFNVVAWHGNYVQVAENTFRPPYYHRNCMSEFMGLIYGVYEAKADGFSFLGASLHSCMAPDGRTLRRRGDHQQARWADANTPARLAALWPSCLSRR
ncbi:hypothetical protein ZWY2020_047428 [Hordeum vulgare]|nr:hypothetical protein ZWY2020_047428 [Hordeum vulgare]